MILSGRDITEYLDRGELTVAPLDRETQIQPASLDIRLGEDVALAPGQMKNPYSLERIELPNTLTAQLTGRSSIGRQHVVVHQTAGWFDPGFHGHATFEMCNHSDAYRTFERGDRIAQFVFMEVKTESSGYDGQYQGQGPGF